MVEDAQGMPSGQDPTQQGGLAKPGAARLDRRSEMTRIQHVKRRRRYAFAVIGGLMLVIVGILFAGYFVVFVRPPQQLVVRVNDVSYSRGDMVKILRMRQRALEQTGERIDNSIDIFQALQLIVENEIISQTAPSLGITTSDEEVKEQIRLSVAQLSGTNAFGKSTDQQEREFSEQYGRFLNESQMSEEEHQSIIRRVILREKVRQFLGDSVPLVAKQYHIYRLTMQSGDELSIMHTKYNDMVRTSTDPILLGEAFKNITREFSRESAESVRVGGNLGWIPLGVLAEYDDEISKLEIGELSDPIRNRDQQDQLFVFMVSETDEFRDIKPDHREVLKNNALNTWVN
ncbi:MAG: SurA N-terminal domain-containing protein, partial [Chloroflexi bacterium]|nr:SurA N-terminal domain-containing protein [Chloroflexota bacterium]